jgi:hypothetical protein
MELMLRSIFTLFALSPALSLAQAPEALTQQKMLEELKGIRGALERLENSQRLLAGMLRIQIDEQRVAALEAQRLQLSAREAELNKEVAGMVGRLQHTRSRESLPELQEVTGTSERLTTGDVSPWAIRHAEATKQAEETRRAKQNLEESIARLRARIASFEKYLEGATR